jgi:flagellar assembly protein FliH
MFLSKSDKSPESTLKVRDFELPRFSEEISVQETSEYVFTPFGGGPEDVAMTLAQAQEEAKQIIERANADADRIKTEAEAYLAEAKQLKAEAAEKGREAGYQEGLEKGRQEGQAGFEAEITPTLTALRKVEDLYHELWEVNEASMVKLSVIVAERVLLHEIKTSPEVIEAAFKAALDHLHEQHHALLRLNPEDLEHLESVRDKMRDQINGLVKITFEADPNLSRGDLIMETDAGRLDATLKRRLESVAASVEEVLIDSFVADW